LGTEKVKNTRDLALIIFFAVLNFIFMAVIGQVANSITGIPGIGYAFIIFYSIIASVAWLMYEGRRWRIFAQGLLFNSLAVLFIPSRRSPTVIGAILNVLIVDLIFDSVYGFFEKKNKLLWWIILLQVFFWAIAPLWDVLFLSLFVYPLESVLKVWFIPIMSLMLPVMMIEAVAGGYMGYKIYRRVGKLA
jgi:hypothetical protein